MSHTVRSLAFAAGAAGLALAVGFSGPAQAQEVKLGALNGMTGGLAAYSPPILDGSKLAVQHVNDQGGILGGRKLTIVNGDTQSNPQGAVDAAQKLVNVDGVVGIVGALASSATIASSKSVSIPAGIPQISPASTSPEISKLADKDFLFRTTVSDAYQGVVLADATWKRGIREVALNYINNDYGKGLADAFHDAFVKLGGKVTAQAAHEENKASYRAELATLAKGSPQGLVLIAYPDSGGKLIMREALENGFFTRFIMTDGMRQAEVMQEIGPQNLKGSFGTGAESPGDTTAAQKFDKAYSAAFETTKDKFYIRESYDAAFLLALAIEQAGSTEGAKVRDALRDVCCPPGEPIEPGEWEKAKAAIAAGKGVDYVGAAGSQNFDPAGDVEGTIGVWEVQPNGDMKVVKIYGM